MLRERFHFSSLNPHRSLIAPGDRLVGFRPIGMRILTMPPVVFALLAFVVSLFCSRTSLCLEHLALRHQLAVYKQTVPRPRLRPTDRLFWAWLSRLWPGWQARPGVCPAPDGDCLATEALPRPLAAPEPARKAWSPSHCQGGARPDPGHVAGESRRGARPGLWGNCGSSALTWRSRRWRSIVSDHKRPPSPTWKTFLEEPRAGRGRPGFLCRADRDV